MKKLMSVMCLLLTFQGYAQKVIKPTTAASRGEGVGNGGEVVWIDGKPVVRDMIDPTNCEWKRGETVFEEVTKLSQLIEKVKKVNWYFGFDLERTIKDKDYCFTRQLYKIDTRDEDDISKPSKLETEQAGIVLDEVYIDLDNFDPMNGIQKAIFLVHENMHSYLAEYEPMRNKKVRSMTALIGKIAAGISISPEDFEFNLEKNGVIIPENSKKLNLHRKSLDFIFASTEERQATLLMTDNFSKFFKDLEKAQKLNLEDLYYEDYLVVSENSELSAKEIIKEACEADNGDLLSRFINIKKIAEINPRVICLGKIKNLQNIKTIEVLSDSQELKNEMVAFLKKLSKKEITLVKRRLKANKELEILAYHEGRVEEKRSFLELSQAVLKSGTQLDPELEGFVNYLAILLKLDKEKEVAELTYANSDFYRAFELKSLLNQILNRTVIDRERLPAIKNLNAIMEGVFEAIFKRLEDLVEKNKQDSLKEKINFERLGIKNK